MDENFTIRTPDHHRNLFVELHALQRQGIACDVILAVEDGEVMAHRVVLMAVSKYLKQKLMSSLQDKLSKIFLQGVSITELVGIVKYIYSGRLLVDKDSIYMTIEVCEMLELEDLLKGLKDILGQYAFEEKHDILSDGKNVKACSSFSSVSSDEEVEVVNPNTKITDMVESFTGIDVIDLSTENDDFTTSQMGTSDNIHPDLNGQLTDVDRRDTSNVSVDLEDTEGNQTTGLSTVTCTVTHRSQSNIVNLAPHTSESNIIHDDCVIEYADETVRSVSVNEINSGSIPGLAKSPLRLSPSSFSGEYISDEEDIFSVTTEVDMPMSRPKNVSDVNRETRVCPVEASMWSETPPASSYLASLNSHHVIQNKSEELVKEMHCVNVTQDQTHPAKLKLPERAKDCLTKLMTSTERSEINCSSAKEVGSETRTLTSPFDSQNKCVSVDRENSSVPESVCENPNIAGYSGGNIFEHEESQSFKNLNDNNTVNMDDIRYSLQETSRVKKIKERNVVSYTSWLISENNNAAIVFPSKETNLNVALKSARISKVKSDFRKGSLYESRNQCRQFGHGLRSYNNTDSKLVSKRSLHENERNSVLVVKLRRLTQHEITSWLKKKTSKGTFTKLGRPYGTKDRNEHVRKKRGKGNIEPNEHESAETKNTYTRDTRSKGIYDKDLIKCRFCSRKFMSVCCLKQHLTEHGSKGDIYTNKIRKLKAPIYKTKSHRVRSYIRTGHDKDITVGCDCYIKVNGNTAHPAVENTVARSPFKTEIYKDRLRPNRASSMCRLQETNFIDDKDIYLSPEPRGLLYINESEPPLEVEQRNKQISKKSARRPGRPSKHANKDGHGCTESIKKGVLQLNDNDCREIKEKAKSSDLSVKEDRSDRNKGQSNKHSSREAEPSSDCSGSFRNFTNLAPGDYIVPDIRVLNMKEEVIDLSLD